MAQLHLPAQHSDDDLAIAGALAQVLRSEELWVAWSSESGAGEPVIPAKLHVPAAEPDAPAAPRSRGGLLARLFGFRRAG
jgi:hypothetical protein